MKRENCSFRIILSRILIYLKQLAFLNQDQFLRYLGDTVLRTFAHVTALKFLLSSVTW